MFVEATACQSWRIFETVYRSYGRIFSRFWYIERQIMTSRWNLGWESFKVIENSAVQWIIDDNILLL